MQPRPRKRAQQPNASKLLLTRRKNTDEPVPSKTYDRTLHGWAIGTLLEAHAIIECPEHGHIRDRGSWAHGWDEARAIAKSHPLVGNTSRHCVEAIDEVMSSIGDVCPEC